MGLLERAARFAVGQSTWGHLLVWRRDRYGELVARLRARVKRFDDALAAFGQALVAYDNLPGPTPDADRFAALQRAESLLSTALSPLPATPALLRAALDTLGADFAAKRKQLDDVAEGAEPTLADLHAATTALLPLSAFDAEPFTLDELEDEILTFAAGLAGAAGGLRDELKRRGDLAQTALTAHAAAAGGADQVAALRDAAHALLGDGFQLIPEFTLEAEQGAEWQKALAASTGGELLAHLHAQTEIDFPVDEWLAGAARVRGQLRHLEQASLMSAALGADEIELVPLQLPHVPGDGWLALDFPADQKIDGDRVLYTASYATPFTPVGRQCGLLLDEWTEVVPGDIAQTGLTFHYDQPNSEAPQSLLLVAPASWDGAWQWEDLTGAVTRRSSWPSAARSSPIRSTRAPTRASCRRRSWRRRRWASPSRPCWPSTTAWPTSSPRRHEMAEQAVDIKHFVSLDLAEAIVEKALPAITVYNRLEGAAAHAGLPARAEGRGP